MKKTVKEADAKSIKILEKEVVDLRKEIATKTLDAKSNPQKDSNSLIKKRKKLAVLLTVLNQKKTSELTNKKVA